MPLLQIPGGKEHWGLNNWYLNEYERKIFHTFIDLDI
jgi:hypothetical protein